jgi:hypothetical protein
VVSSTAVGAWRVGCSVGVDITPDMQAREAEVKTATMLNSIHTLFVFSIGV